MSRFHVHPLVRASVREEGRARVLSAELEDRIAALWRDECERRAAPLVDAPLFNVTGFDPDGIVGHFVPYRRWIAQCKAPDLREHLHVQPGSVCALSFAGDDLLFGKRSSNTTQDPGCWEPVPAGGLGPEARTRDGALDAARQLVHELHEEVGLAEDRISHSRPFALVVDRETGVHDLVFELLLEAGRDEIESAFSQRPTREVTAYRCVPRMSVANWMREHAAEIAPITQTLLDAHANARQGRDSSSGASNETGWTRP